jgi:glycosyltransferase involved in cell wall biosynthesis
MPSSPQFSILMPVSTQRQYLTAAAESVLGQTAGNLELIVIDDAGNAPECACLAGEGRDPRVRVISNTISPGPAEALNCGLQASRGEVICLCDADDLYPPDHLRRHSDLLAAHADCAAVAGGMETLTSRGGAIAWLHRDKQAGEITDELRSGVTRTSFCTYATRREAMLTIAPFRRYFLTSYDIDFQLRFGDQFRVWFDPAISYRWRLHDKSVTHTQANNQREFFEATAREFQRQRKSTGQDDLQRGKAPQPPAAHQPKEGEPHSLKSADQTQQMLLGASWRHHQSGEKFKAISLGFRACMAKPGRISAWKSLAALAVKKAGNGKTP